MSHSENIMRLFRYEYAGTLEISDKSASLKMSGGITITKNEYDYYYRVKGKFPLKFCKSIEKIDFLHKFCRADGDCANRGPEFWAVWVSKATGNRIITEGELEDMKKEFPRLYSRESLLAAGFEFVPDSELDEKAEKIIESYHIDESGALLVFLSEWYLYIVNYY